jgi:hypothetical protein
MSVSGFLGTCRTLLSDFVTCMTSTPSTKVRLNGLDAFSHDARDRILLARERASPAA